ncbi:uncharacterized, partial [Tachysurus ichikawai]
LAGAREDDDDSVWCNLARCRRAELGFSEEISRDLLCVCGGALLWG